VSGRLEWIILSVVALCLSCSQPATERWQLITRTADLTISVDRSTITRSRDTVRFWTRLKFLEDLDTDTTIVRAAASQTYRKYRNQGLNHSEALLQTVQSILATPLPNASDTTFLTRPRVPPALLQDLHIAVDCPQRTMQLISWRSVREGDQTLPDAGQFPQTSFSITPESLAEALFTSACGT